MAQLLIGTTSVDVNDVALVAPRGALSTVYLADNSFLESALTPAAQRTAINGTAAGTVLTTAITSTNFGVCYVGAGNVQRIDASADALGCRIELRGGPGAVVAPALTVSAAATLVNAAAPGTSGSTVVPWTPVPASAQATALTAVFSSAIRTGNFMTATFYVTGTSTPTGSVTITTPLPVASTAITPGLAQGDAGAGLGAAVAASANAGNLILTFTGAAATPFAYWTSVTYPVA